MEHNYGCLLVDLCGLRIRSFSDLRDYAINRLKPDFEMLIQQHRFREAWKLASTYGAAQGIHHPCALVELLAAHPDTPMLLKAKAFLWLMEFLDRVKTHRDCETDDSNWNKLYMLARAAWESLDHADGIIPLERSQTYNGNSFQADVLTRCLKHYEHLDNRTQLILTWSRIQGIAGRLGNITKADEAAMEMEEIAKRTGSRLLWMVTRCSVLRNWTIRAAHHGKFISAASALYEELNKTDFFYTRGLAAGHAAVSYINLFDAPLAVMWARRHHTLWLQCPRPDQSKAAFTLLKAEMLNTSQEGGGNSQSIVEMSEKLVQQDIEDNLIENAIAKLDALVTHVSMHQSGATSLREAFDPIFARMRKLIAQLPERTSRLELAKLLQLATITLISEASTRSDIVKEAEAILILDEVCRLYIEATEGPSLVVSSIHQQQGVLCLSMLKKLDRGTTQAITVWEQALEYFGTARGVFAEQGFAREAAISSYWESVLYSDAYLQGYQSAEVALEHLADAERCFALLRTELSAVGGLDAVAIKQRLSSGTYIQDIYRQSFHICSRSGYSLEAWTWTQKSKARSLADLLGLGILVPRAMIDSISSNEDASLLYDEEMALIKEINSAPAAAHFKLKLRLEKLHKHMKNVPVLQDLLDLRAGVPLSWERLQAQLNTQKRLVLVDWVLKGIEIWMIVVRSSVEPAMITLWLNVSTIQTWVDKYLTSPTGLEESIKKDDRDPDNPLRQLDGLVTPLRSFSEPEDILVFCPTSFLHSLPLHALHIDHLTPVIERNPVIYCASLTTFMQCCQRAAESPNNSILEKKIIAVYEPSPDEPFDDVERDEAYASAKRCAAEHNGISLCGRSVTHQAFTSMLEETNMLVYHGHCDLDKRDITNQSLRLSSPDGSPSKGTIAHRFKR